MEFIFQLFAQMLSGNDEPQRQETLEAPATDNVADYECDADEAPIPAVNIFEYVNFH